jgi:threonine dehydrogenase-like Zn-dependent dehydrogenase
MGANVIAVDVSDEKLAAAKDEGALHTINAAKDEPIRAIIGLTAGGAHVSIDALGVAATCRNSVLCVRKRGRHVQVGLTSGAEKGEIALPIDVIVLKEIRILGSLGMQASHFGAMLQMVERGRLNPGKLVHRKIPLEEASGVLESMDQYGTLGVTVINQY